MLDERGAILRGGGSRAMNEEISDEELDEIERRCAAASPGPWRSFVEGRDHESGSELIRTGAEDIELSGGTREDQEFIAHSRQDVARLVAYIRGLKSGFAK